MEKEKEYQNVGSLVMYDTSVRVWRGSDYESVVDISVNYHILSRKHRPPGIKRGMPWQRLFSYLKTKDIDIKVEIWTLRGKSKFQVVLPVLCGRRRCNQWKSYTITWDCLTWIDRCWKDKDSLTLELVPLNHWANSFQGTHVVNLEKRDEYL